jgi:hypothetical protein
MLQNGQLFGNIKARGTEKSEAIACASTVNRVVYMKRIIGQLEGRVGEEAQGVAAPPSPPKNPDKSPRPVLKSITSCKKTDASCEIASFLNSNFFSAGSSINFKFRSCKFKYKYI